MGMRVRVDVRDPDADRSAIGDVFAWLRFVDATFSTYRPRSEISRIGRGELARADAHPRVREVLDRCEELCEETGGLFDMRAAGALDPSGFVKGWAVERGAALLDAAGARRFLVDAGGDVVLRGGPWRVGIRHPARRDRLAAVLALSDCAVATSGAYERGAAHHRSAHAPPGARRAVGHRRRPRPGHRRRLCHGRVCAGRPRARVDCDASRYDAMTILPGKRVLTTPAFRRHCSLMTGETR